MGGQMKYLLACLVIPTAHILFVVAFLLGALYFGADYLLARMKQEKINDGSQLFTGRRSR